MMRFNDPALPRRPYANGSQYSNTGFNEDYADGDDGMGMRMGMGGKPAGMDDEDEEEP
eukprot:CAMPEP_0182862404 /NCGR_PEP_ID=MMETSP0034_2-20130328/6042_1 /TAXON_ID=156128 /ORGANISM="Nephroselmis pyriformis, Strain CCMP717" /LENGTH=57 /DNA_ID=CAMNT_0024994451 /DNA_START=53 /DNA_END=223 /DNA_ORIENTATION=-